jgi:hypothetical protein
LLVIRSLVTKGLVKVFFLFVVLNVDFFMKVAYPQCPGWLHLSTISFFEEGLTMVEVLFSVSWCLVSALRLFLFLQTIKTLVFL